MNIDYQKELTDRLDIASVKYYNGQESEFSDTDFDLKLKELQKLEKENNFIFPNSPTQRVGSDLRKEFGKISHPEGFPMLTIENCYNDDELRSWFVKMLEKGETWFNVSLKYDGISGEIKYVDGYLKSGSTRGDKLVGDDITENIRTIKSVPLKIKAYGEVFVRGEVLMPKSALKSLNEANIASGKQPFANCRNACSGSIKQLDSRITANRGLIFRPWDLFFGGSNQQIEFQTSKFDILRQMGFVIDKGTEPFCVCVGCDKDIDVAIEKIRQIWEIAKQQDYECDGIVIKCDHYSIQKKIGTSDHRAIEWGIARKWNEEKEVSTFIESVDFQVGRTGNITPVARLKPVPCDGVTISNATLNNEKFIRELDIHIGDELRVVRSGGVIPYVVGNNSKDYPIGDDVEDTVIKFPEVCPECGTPLIKDGEIWKCPNSRFCPPQREGRIEQWCSKDCMDIRDVGPEMIHDLVEKKLVDSPMDLYEIAEHSSVSFLIDILGVGYGEKKIKKFIENVINSKTRTFDKVLFGLSIDGIGKQNAKMIASEFRSYTNLKKATKEELMALDGIGEVLADSIISWFKENDEFNFFENALKEHGLSMEMNEDVENAQNEQILGGLNIVFSGKSQNWDGDDVEVVFESYGAKCGHSVSKKTDFLVIGEKPGPAKVKKANEIGVEVISENDFIKKFGIPVEDSDGFVFPDDLPSHPSDTEELF